MNVEAQLLDLIMRLRALETRARTGDDVTTTAMIGTALVLAELAGLRAEMRQDLAAFGDELAGLRRHMNDHLSAVRAELPQRLGVPPSGA
ncbi:hypothetical protein ABGB18_43035 [Nonomuraea sp. B12E4]|uniref:hypothetical protein n=1 Tax=Nonomuraea sp. B12E4 TaxID=3153564 RepID=UPI00325D1DF5